MSRDALFVAVAGNIATGKTSLVEALAPALGVAPYLERWDRNPWFSAQSPNLLASQLWFMISTGRDHARIAAGGGVQERPIYEDAAVFCAELLEGDEATLAQDSFALLDEVLPVPDVLVYLDASPETLMERVRRRSRPQEASVSVDYLTALRRRYAVWLESWNRCPTVALDTEDLDLRSPDGRETAVARVSEAIA